MPIASTGAFVVFLGCFDDKLPTPPRILRMAMSSQSSHLVPYNPRKIKREVPVRGDGR
jgi:hypothetical protein